MYVLWTSFTSRLVKFPHIDYYSGLSNPPCGSASNLFNMKLLLCHFNANELAKNFYNF